MPCHSISICVCILHLIDDGLGEIYCGDVHHSHIVQFAAEVWVTAAYDEDLHTWLHVSTEYISEPLKWLIPFKLLHILGVPMIPKRRLRRSETQVAEFPCSARRWDRVSVWNKRLVRLGLSVLGLNLALKVQFRLEFVWNTASNIHREK